MLKLGVGVGTQHGLCQALCLVTEGVNIVANLTVAQYHTHTTALVSLGLSENADAGTILLQSLLKVVVVSTSGS